MSSSYADKQVALTTELEVSSLSSLLERGLRCAQQGHYAEAAACLALAREQLAPYQVHLATTLDVFIQNHADYWQAQQALHEASRRFAEADAKQQADIVAVERLLSTLTEEQAPYTDPLHNAQHHAQLHIVRSASEHTCADQGASLAEPGEREGSPLLYPHERHDEYSSDDPSRSPSLPPLYVTCLGRFEVRRFGQPIELCSNRSGQTLFRYLIAQLKHRATMDTLMAVLWPEEVAEVARHKLRVAMSALRRSLNSDYVLEPGGGYILCKNRVYELNPLAVLETDVDEFLALYHAGLRAASTTEAVKYYEKACQLYTGPFLVEDLYADWSFPRREHFSQVYLTMCAALADAALKSGRYEDAIRWANAILKENRCDEKAHRQLMQAYAAQGRRNEALRQYQRCQRILDEELSVQPMPETVNLFHALLSGAGKPNTL
jgi:DNA-binding SARP family transcriptional activator